MANPCWCELPGCCSARPSAPVFVFLCPQSCKGRGKWHPGRDALPRLCGNAQAARHAILISA